MLVLFSSCDRPLEKQTHWFCHEHRKEAKVCAVPGCRAPNEFSSHPDKWRTCRLSEHRKQEIVKREQRTLSSADWAKKRKGTTLLGVRGKRGRTTPLVDSSGPTLHPGGDEVSRYCLRPPGVRSGIDLGLPVSGGIGVRVGS